MIHARLLQHLLKRWLAWQHAAAYFSDASSPAAAAYTAKPSSHCYNSVITRPSHLPPHRCRCRCCLSPPNLPQPSLAPASACQAPPAPPEALLFAWQHAQTMKLQAFASCDSKCCQQPSCRSLHHQTRLTLLHAPAICRPAAAAAAYPRHICHCHLLHPL